MINVWDFQDIDDEVRIDLTDGRYLIGTIISVDDVEESELGEDGITVTSAEGGLMGLKQSEIAKITRTGGNNGQG